MEHFNKLTPAEDERLAILMEEMAEAIQIICKIQRHGYDSYNPYLQIEFDGDSYKSTPSPNNRYMLENELGHVLYAIDAMVGFGDLSKPHLNKHKKDKAKKVHKWTHHQSVSDTKNS